MEISTNARSVLYFDAMLMPKIITFIYWLLLLSVLIGAVGAMFSGQFLMSIGVLIFGAVGVRLWCEFIIVLFKMNENLQKIADKS